MMEKQIFPHTNVLECVFPEYANDKYNGERQDVIQQIQPLQTIQRRLSIHVVVYFNYGMAVYMCVPHFFSDYVKKQA